MRVRLRRAEPFLRAAFRTETVMTCPNSDFRRCGGFGFCGSAAQALPPNRNAPSLPAYLPVCLPAGRVQIRQAARAIARRAIRSGRGYVLASLRAYAAIFFFFAACLFACANTAGLPRYVLDGSASHLASIRAALRGYVLASLRAYAAFFCFIFRSGSLILRMCFVFAAIPYPPNGAKGRVRARPLGPRAFLPTAQCSVFCALRSAHPCAFLCGDARRPCRTSLAISLSSYHIYDGSILSQ